MAKKKKQRKKNKVNKIVGVTNNSPQKNNLKSILFFFLLSRGFLIVFLLFKKDLSMFEIHDSIHYINMAKFGYNNPELYAFFPLYPLLIRTLYILIPSYKISGALISNICSLLSLLILNNLTKEKII